MGAMELHLGRLAWLAVTVTAFIVTGCGAAAPTAAPSSPSPSPTTSSTPTTSPTSSASEVTSKNAPSTDLLVKGADAEHTTAGDPRVPWLWDGAINRPDGSQVRTDLHGGGTPLSFAEMPGHPDSYYVLGDSSAGPQLSLVNKSDVPGQTGMGADDPGWSSEGGLVSTPDGSMVAYATTVGMEQPAVAKAWQINLERAGGEKVTRLPDAAAPTLVGILRDGTVVFMTSGSSDIKLAGTDGSVTTMTVTGLPRGASAAPTAASVSPNGGQLTVTFTKDGELKSCWGVASATTGELRAYTCDGGIDPTFSPDGGEIATVGNIDVPMKDEFNLATVYDAETLKAIKVFTTASPGAHGAEYEFFGPTLAWDHDSLLVPAYDSVDAVNGQHGWMLVWLNPTTKPDYQYARSLLVPAKEKSAPPFAFTADSLRVTG